MVSKHLCYHSQPSAAHTPTTSLSTLRKAETLWCARLAQGRLHSARTRPRMPQTDVGTAADRTRPLRAQYQTPDQSLSQALGRPYVCQQRCRCQSRRYGLDSRQCWCWNSWAVPMLWRVVREFSTPRLSYDFLPKRCQPVVVRVRG